MNSDAIPPLAFLILLASWTWCNGILFATAYHELCYKKIHLYAPWYVTAVNVACLGMSGAAFLVVGVRWVNWLNE